MFEVVKRCGRTVEFDTSKISEAIHRACEAVEQASGIMDGMLEKIIGYFAKTTRILAHSLEQWVLHIVYKISNRVRRTFRFNPQSSVLMAAAVCIRAKLLTTSFLEHACVYRAVWLLRTQDRGVNDTSDSDITAMYLDFVATAL
jgi:transcriptional regulator NrdR family protein